EALGVADRVAVMEGGRLRQAAPPSVLYRTPSDGVVSRFVGAGAVVPGEVTATFANGHASVALFGQQWQVRSEPGQAIGPAEICDENAVARAMAGVRYVANAAADYRLWARDPDAIVRTNVEGTRTVMQAALSAGVERVVYTSSVATLALRVDGQAADETLPLAEAAALGAYKRSKVVAERLVEKMIARDALPAVIVHPSTPIGPRDIRPTPTGRVIIAAASGRMPGFVDTGLNLVHVDDVGSGHVAALVRGKVGER